MMTILTGIIFVIIMKKALLLSSKTKFSQKSINILTFLAGRDEASVMSISDKFGLSIGECRKCLNTNVSNGFVARKKLQNNAKMFGYYLTQKGKRIFKNDFRVRSNENAATSNELKLFYRVTVNDRTKKI